MKMFGGKTGSTVLAFWLAVAGTPAWGQDDGAPGDEGAAPAAEQPSGQQAAEESPQAGQAQSSDGGVPAQDQGGEQAQAAESEAGPDSGAPRPDQDSAGNESQTSGDQDGEQSPQEGEAQASDEAEAEQDQGGEQPQAAESDAGSDSGASSPDQDPAEDESGTAQTEASQASDGAGSEQAGESDEPQTDTERAREALQQQEGDASQEKNLEEVFQASEDQYSLLKSGNMSLDFSTNYSYFRDDRIDINFDGSGNINRFRIQNDSQHSLGSSLSFDYGIWDNLTFNTRFPVQYKFDTENDTSQAALGDMSFGLRYQPFPAERGAMNTTLFTTLSTATGKSPYEIDTTTEVSSGKGYYSLGGGLSLSKTVDPVVLFGSFGYTHALDATGLNQGRGSRILEEVQPGDSLNFSYGLAYSLSYEVSLSASYSQSYNFDTTFNFKNGDTAKSEDSTTSTVNMSLGLRSANNRVVNVSFGFGLTEDSPDVNMGFSLPIDITGFKSRNGSTTSAGSGSGGQAGGGGTP